MSSSSNDTFSFQDNGMEGEVVDLRLTGCMCSLTIKKTMTLNINYTIFIGMKYNYLNSRWTMCIFIPIRSFLGITLNAIDDPSNAGVNRSALLKKSERTC